MRRGLLRLLVALAFDMDARVAPHRGKCTQGHTSFCSLAGVSACKSTAGSDAQCSAANAMRSRRRRWSAPLEG